MVFEGFFRKGILKQGDVAIGSSLNKGHSR
jgi:hypothetical protein